ncbi:MAG: phosphoribosyltransferase, partial [Chloroflexota bacterium]
FYRVQWRYEPRSFVLSRHPGGEVSQAFTPDFYLPQFDTYVELTTMRQKHATDKHRKLRRMAEIYPEVRVQLFHRRDIAHLRAAAAPGESRSVEPNPAPEIAIDRATIDRRLAALAADIDRDYAERVGGGKPLLLLGVLRGCGFFLADLARLLSNRPEIDYIGFKEHAVARGTGPAIRVVRQGNVDLAGRHVLLVKDAVSTGLSLDYTMKWLRAARPASLAVCSLLVREGRQIGSRPIRYGAFSVGADFFVGYGLAYRERYRALPYIGRIEPPDLPRNGTNPD